MVAGIVVLGTSCGTDSSDVAEPQPSLATPEPTTSSTANPASASQDFCDAMTRPLLLGTIGVDDVFLPELDRRLSSWRAGIDAIVFLDPDVSDDEVSAAKELIEAQPGASIVEFVDKEAAYREFLETFEDSANIRGSVTVADMPPSYRLRLVPTASDTDTQREQRNQFKDLIRVQPGVFEIVMAPAFELTPVPVDDVSAADLLLAPRLLPAVIVYMAPGSEPEAQDGIVQRLEEVGARYKRYDQQQSFEEFQQLFPDRPDVGVEDMPPSLRSEFVPGYPELADGFRSVPGVFEVIEASPESNQTLVLVVAELLSRSEAEQAVAQARDALPEQRDTLDPLGDGLVGYKPESLFGPWFYEESYRTASDLRDLLVAECGYADQFSSRITAPLGLLVDELITTE